MNTELSAPGGGFVDGEMDDNYKCHDTTRLQAQTLAKSIIRRSIHPRTNVPRHVFFRLTP